MDGLRVGELKVRSTVVRLSLVLAGIVLWLLAFIVDDFVVLNVHVGTILGSLGVLIATAVLLQWIFDEKFRDALIVQIARSAAGAERVARSGVNDYLDDSKKIRYDELIVNSRRMIVGFHYSPRLLEDNFSLIMRRTKTEQLTIFILLERDSPALDYLSNVRVESSHIEPNLKKLETHIVDLRRSGVSVRELRHRMVMRYSFALFDNCVWIKFYKNSRGLSVVPAIEVRGPSPLFEFFETDILAFVQSAEAGAGEQ